MDPEPEWGDVIGNPGTFTGPLLSVPALEVAISCGYKPQSTSLDVAYSETSITCPAANTGGFLGTGFGWRQRRWETTSAAVSYRLSVDYNPHSTDGTGGATDTGIVVAVGSLYGSLWTTGLSRSWRRNMWDDLYVGPLCDIYIDVLASSYSILNLSPYTMY
jgi:hypothetical protein